MQGKVRFLEFVFDPASGELLRQGRRIRLPDQSARLLAIFVENPGVVLTREYLRSRLWADTDFLDYEQSINKAISQLRFSLRDFSSRPARGAHLCIETLPKRGYRFVAPVWPDPEWKPLPGPDAAASAGGVEATSAQAGTPSPVPMPGQPLPQQGRLTGPDSAASGSGAADTSAADTSAADTGTAGTGTADTDTAGPWNARRKQGRRAGDLPAGSRPSAFASALAAIRRNAVWWLLAAAVLAGALIFLSMHRSAAPTPADAPLSLGLVPFEATGPGADPLAESFRLDLADSLSQVPQLTIIGLNSFNGLDHDEARIQARAVQLKIDAILFGHLTVSGDQCEFELEMVRSIDGVHVLSLQYKGRREELASIRDRIESDLFQRLRHTSQPNALSLQKAISPAAYASYLQGRAYLVSSTDASLHQAVHSFEDSLKIDPLYARAYAGAATAYYTLSHRASGERVTSIEKSRRLASQGLALDSSLAEAHAVLGEIAMTEDWNFAEANKQLQLSIQIDPWHASYHQWAAYLYSVEGKSDIASQEIEKARAADPGWNSIYLTEIYIAVKSHRFDQADRYSLQLLERMPDWALAHENYGMVLWESKRYPEAIDEWHKAALLEKDTAWTRLEESGPGIFRRGGVPAYARSRLQFIDAHKEIVHDTYSFDLPVWYAYAGDRQKSLEGIEALVKNHSNDALEINTNRAYEHLHHDTRFLASIRKIGLPEPVDEH